MSTREAGFIHPCRKLAHAQRPEVREFLLVLAILETFCTECAYENERSSDIHMPANET